ncbi:MAG: hypothetical protein ACK559_07650, partial [bacterium]
GPAGAAVGGGGDRVGGGGLDGQGGPVFAEAAHVRGLDQHAVREVGGEQAHLRRLGIGPDHHLPELPGVAGGHAAGRQEGRPVLIGEGGAVAHVDWGDGAAAGVDDEGHG